MKTKKEIQEKLKEAENGRVGAGAAKEQRLEVVIKTLHWTLGTPITSPPIDPVTEE